VRIFKATYTDSGLRRFTRKWYLDVFDHAQVRHRIPAFEDKRQSEALGRRIGDLISLKVSGMTPDVETQRWIDGLPKSLLQKLVSWGLISPERIAIGRGLPEHLADFRRSLGDTRHAKQTERALQVAFVACGFRTWTDLSGSRFQQHLQERLTSKDKTQRISQRTYNWTLHAAQHFGRWMIRDGRTHASPFEYVRPVKVTVAEKRRALTPAEVDKLLATTWDSGVVDGMPGPVRGLLYILAVETGLRRSELLSLTAGSFNFVQKTVTVKAAYTKNRKEATLPLTTWTVAMLTELTRNMPTVARVFVLSGGESSLSKAFKIDLKAAGINAADDGTGRLCFHCLRHTTASLLAAAGVHPKVAMDLMRHSDINLTLARYSHTVPGQLAEAVSRLPSLMSSVEAQAGQTFMAMTGIDGVETAPADKQNHFATYFATCLAKLDRPGRTVVDAPGRMTKVQNATADSENAENMDSRSENLNGRSRTRTLDPLIKSQLLYQLS
jgi:integrase